MGTNLKILRNILLFCATSSLCVSGPCKSNPCQNGATCVLGVGESYFCTCAPSFTGYNCETAFSACQSQPCQNGGSCYPGIGRSYYCTCDAGFSGRNCAEEFDPCMSQPCQHGASCFPGIGGSYYCTCAPGYSGYSCETEFYPCISQPCQNGASCFPGVGRSYYCTCAFGYFGYNCETELETETLVVSTKTPEDTSVLVVIIVVVSICAVTTIVLILAGVFYLRYKIDLNKEDRQTESNVKYINEGSPLPLRKGWEESNASSNESTGNSVSLPARESNVSAGYEDATTDKEYKEKQESFEGARSSSMERENDGIYEEIPEESNNYDRTLYISNGSLGAIESHKETKYVNRRRLIKMIR